jgi:hypothetical protein
MRTVTIHAAVTVVSLLAMTVAAFWLPGSEIAHNLATELR